MHRSNSSCPPLGPTESAHRRVELDRVLQAFGDCFLDFVGASVRTQLPSTRLLTLSHETSGVVLTLGGTFTEPEQRWRFETVDAGVRAWLHFDDV